jgi:CRISPR-associated exonuclease Cas4
MAQSTISHDVAEMPIPISALQHAVYCLRQAALIHLERLWAENRRTAEGRVMHDAADTPSERLRAGVRVVTALPLSSALLGIVGTADRVEFHPAADGGETPYPVEYKRGKPKLHRADEVQLCAQALCLEEMTDRPVPEGALFYGETRRRLIVPIDDGLRTLTRKVIADLSAIFESRQTPPAVYKSALCRGCSLIELCRPKLARRSALNWCAARLSEILAEEIPGAQTGSDV